MPLLFAISGFTENDVHYDRLVVLHLVAFSLRRHATFSWLTAALFNLGQSFNNVHVYRIAPQTAKATATATTTTAAWGTSSGNKEAHST